MPDDKQFSALLFELQSARSPLDQAKVLARSWRALRRLSPTDRKMLARHVGFEGAEELLEGLAGRSGGLAPAMLLQVLAKARSSDAGTVRELVRAIRDPARREEAIAKGVDFVADALAHEEAEGEPEDMEDQAVADHEVPPENPFELAIPNGEVDESESRPPPPPPAIEPPEASPEARADELDADEPDDDQDLAERPQGEPIETEPPPPLPTPEPVTAPVRQVVDWGHWDAIEFPSVTESVPTEPVTVEETPVDRQTWIAGEVDRDTTSVLAVEERSPVARLRHLREGASALRSATPEALIARIEALPDGWLRRRAVAALFEEGVPSDPQQALQIVGHLDRAMDRAWCLSILARAGRLDDHLEDALALLDSRGARRRIESIITSRA